MGSRIRKGSLAHRRIQSTVQSFFADPANGRVNPDTGILEVAGPETLRQLADTISGRTAETKSGLEVFEAWDQEDQEMDAQQLQDLKSRRDFLEDRLEETDDLQEAGRLTLELNNIHMEISLLEERGRPRLQRDLPDGMDVCDICQGLGIVPGEDEAGQECDRCGGSGLIPATESTIFDRMGDE